MTFVSNWLMQIVLVLLFAVVVDLVLPSSSMRHYVKLVMGLVIMVTMLKPVSVLFDNRFDISRINWPQSVTTFTSLDTIQKKASDFQQEQIKEAEQSWNQKLTKLIKEQVEQTYPVKVLQVDAKIKQADLTSLQNYEIERLRLQLREKQTASPNSSIQPVKPVEIEIQPKTNTPAAPATSDGQTQIANQIKQSLANRLQTPDSIIQVEWEVTR
ncbi:stage III sporulation protein AF [Effusibacillus dendaii]|uniref:Stage III sporulation protein AF n=1 Tax=Effusibacillus dendaii TaxID=2743772 RepID=A0A7I8D778_9BACL|nr:stage III sporulation protein AF [Effusibacillus dendaii]BCJ85925.1 hypothetical protein skT53_09100 [Effusibacillus dendaii]